MNDAEPKQDAKKGDAELNRVMKKFIFWGSIKLLVLSAITAIVIYFYL